jgi:hypothetical protein
MKTTIEVHGYEIKIDEMNDKILVSAVKEGETVEEFELDVEAGFEDDDMGRMDAFGEEGDEEEDFDGEDMEDMDDEDMDKGSDYKMINGQELEKALEMLGIKVNR